MKKVYYLSTCDTCKRIMKDLPLNDFEKQDIKFNPITSDQYDFLRSKVDKGEDLTNKRARKFKELGLKDKVLSEAEIKELITTEHTFLKRPVFIDGEHIFVGNSKKTVESLTQYLA